MNPTTKYLISRGWFGFADRMNALCHCIRLARLRNRILNVYWSDRMIGESFQDLFNIINLPYTDVVPDLDTYPQIFRPLRNIPNELWIYELKDYELSEANASILVHSGRGKRTFNVTDLVTHLRFTEKTIEEVRNVLTKYTELGVTKDTKVVHLRGTDRPWKLEDVHTLAKQHGKVAIVSDDKLAVEAYLSKEPTSIVLTNGADNLKPLHKDDPSRAKTIKMLADFCLLHTHGVDTLNKESLFWKLSQRIDPLLWMRLSPEPTTYNEFFMRSTHAT